MNFHSKILITGANGLVGSALLEELQKQGYSNVIPLTRDCCDLTHFEDVKKAFHSIKPDIVFHLAASVYGIGGNVKHRAPIFLKNILMNTHVIEASQQASVKKFVGMGTVAAYPNPQSIPVTEEQIWSGPPHGSESSYGHAKRAMLAQLLAYHENYDLDYAYVISTNLYGPNDKFDSQTGHVIPSLIRKFYEAKKNNTPVMIWGDGTSARDFLYSKDMARALCLIMNQHTGPINVASGIRVQIKEVVQLLADRFEMHEKVMWNDKMPNGRDFHPVDLSNLSATGFKPEYTMERGLRETVDWFESVYEQNLLRC